MRCEILCKHCQKLFFPKKKSGKYCCRKCSEFASRLIAKTCLECNNLFQPKISEQRFCNQSCSASYNNKKRKHSEETKQKLSEAAKRNPSGAILNPENVNKTIARNKAKLAERVEIYLKNPKRCHCEEIITYDRRSSKMCLNCSKNYRRGGYKKGSTRSKHGWYKDIWCDSSYELAFVIYHLDMGIKIERTSNFFNYIDEKGKDRRYYPDFQIGNEIYEIKGRITEETLLKSKSAKNVILIDKEQCKEYIDYVVKQYNISQYRLEELYDKSDVLNEHICVICNKSFFRNKKNKSMKLVCSQVCTGKLVAKKEWRT